MKHTYIYIAALVALVASSCSGVKDLTPPRLDLPEQYAGQGADSLTVADTEWWAFYADEPLARIITRTLDHNRDLLAAASRVEEARRLYGVEKVNMTPTVTGLAGGKQENLDYGGEGMKHDPEYDLKVSVGWEINLWGAMTWARREAKANYLASVEDMRAMRMTLIAEVASTYFRLIALDNELNIVKQTLVTRSESLEQARLRFEGGLTSETVYQQAKVEYATTASLVPALEHRITVSRNALTLLMGECPADDIARSTLYLNESIPDKLPAGVPSELVKRRPDILAASHRLSAAMAEAGLTYADRFPRLKISLIGGIENDALKRFFKSPYTYVGGDIAGTILDFGRKKRRHQAAVAAYDQARYRYEQTVIQAFTEVDDAISAFRHAQSTARLKGELHEAARKYVELARTQYLGGSIGYIDVLDAQRRYFDARIGLSNALRDQYLAVVGLYKALGGGA
ncbi:MAG: TolC family protein [Alloprevotella sp.]|nr:TolC family protein [Alloprevotella sp.]